MNMLIVQPALYQLEVCKYRTQKIDKILNEAKWLSLLRKNATAKALLLFAIFILII